MRITYQQLVEWGACESALLVVAEHFGTGEIELSRENLIRAADLGLNIFWFAASLLSSQQSGRFFFLERPFWIKRFTCEIDKTEHLEAAANILNDILEGK